MMEIERKLRKSKGIPLVSLIDVVFQLLIYFMLTTSFTRSESLELSLPAQADAKKLALDKREDAQTVHIYIADSGDTFLERERISEQDMARELRALLAVNPNRGFLVLSASQVQVGVMVHVLDRIYTAGGTNIAVADWVQPKVPEKSADKAQEQKAHG